MDLYTVHRTPLIDKLLDNKRCERNNNRVGKVQCTHSNNNLRTVLSASLVVSPIWI
jgi:hypothetical protein